MFLKLYQKVSVSTLKHYTVVFGNRKHYNIYSNNLLLKICTRECHNNPHTCKSQKKGPTKVEGGNTPKTEQTVVLQDNNTKWDRRVRGEAPPVSTIKYNIIQVIY